jgi:phospholipid N-methyltransferase
LRNLADKMQPEIDNKFGDRLANTPKRMRETACARLEGEQLQRTQTVLYALADMYEAGNVPDILKSFTTKKSIYDLMYSKKTNSGGYYDAPICTGQPYYDTEESKALWALLTPKSKDDLEAEELKRQIDKLQFANIPGYFPTPEPVTDKMIQYADLAEYQDIMEPSAGSGNIIKAIDKTGFNHGIRLAIEYNCTLSNILSKSCKNWDVHQGDFLEQSDIGYYDRIIMNPPFDMGSDIKHIKHAITFLKPGGRLVALCANGPRQQDQLQPLADHWEVLPEGSFKQAGTNVNVALLVINN